MIKHALNETQRMLRLEIAGDLCGDAAQKEALSEIDAIFSEKTVQKKSWAVLLLDLTSTQNIDSMGLSVLIELIRKVDARSATTKVRIGSKLVYNIFVFTRLDKRVEIEMADHLTTSDHLGLWVKKSSPRIAARTDTARKQRLDQSPSLTPEQDLSPTVRRSLAARSASATTTSPSLKVESST